MKKDMGKAPAFQFYYDRFNSSTSLWSDEQVGRYVRLLIQQANSGYVTDKQLQRVVPDGDQEVLCKFVEIEPGRFINKVLQGILDERDAYRESRRQNRLNGKKNKTHEEDMKNICSSYDEHMVVVDVGVDSSSNGNGKKEKTRAKKLNAADLIPDSWDRDEFLGLWEQFVQMRKEKRKPLTVVAIKRAIEKIQAEAGADWSKAKAVIEQTLERGWDGFFPVKAQEAAKQPARPSSDPAVEPDYWTKRFESKMEEQRKRLIKPQAQ